ncbi:MAG: hypothetical protein IPO81_01370 [Kouleothrix sp.]|nr:hypothetical protein [Kouleothrix sp.]
MTLHTTQQAIPYITTISHVREVNLYGTADLPFWQDRLREVGLAPYAEDGSAHLLLSGTDLAWQGIRFQEFVISIFVCQSRDSAAPDGVYLVHAFNSSRMLAWMERAFFQTPYAFRAVQIETSAPASVTLSGPAGAAFRATMGSATTCLRSEESIWENPIYLPERGATPQRSRRRFFVRLGGPTEIYPSTTSDTLEIRPAERDTALRQLVDSRFTIKEWRIGRDATHARSRTYSFGA